ncbi:amino acid ABC transporter permease [Rhizobiaceae bacterium BDR2-2]|uniref:Amino acid ABC transporter permease n=1 Tax=Ectorhizobium quercum TaxID=2965071 RepID=A0AAE3MZQ1_9HYPH|nr:amino acid ABC transporter permease [Ectorhizobium quercum]MCX8997332.1 amino acid ABC transporter permease [Ectorhizobium quercum]
MNTVLLMSLIAGLGNTIVLSLLTFLFGGLAGALIALARISSVPAIRRAASVYIQIVQGIPLLVLMGLCFFGPNIIGMRGVAPLTAATLAMSIYTSAYMGEIWRGCLQSVARAQWEAAECLGLGRAQRMWHVIAPQAVRIAIPPTVGFMVQIIKNTSIASLIVGFPELTYNAKIINNATFEPFLYFGLAGALYFAVCFPVSELSRAMERKLNVSRR